MQHFDDGTLIVLRALSLVALLAATQKNGTCIIYSL